MSIRVRTLEDADKAAWTRLFRDYIAFYRADVPDAVIELTWRRLRGPDDDMLGLAAIDESGGIIGIALAVFHPSTWSATGYCYLEDLFVVPEARGRGAGRALIETLYRVADARGVTRTYWVTEEDNVAARRLYDSLAAKAPFVQYRRR